MIKKLYYIIIFTFCIMMLLLNTISALGTNVTQKPIELRFGINYSPTGFDPVTMASDWDYIPNINACDTLIYPDPESIEGFKPWVADSWKISPDGLKYTFYLKKGIPFHDGNEITAEDVLFTMDRILTVPGNIAAYFGELSVGSTKVIDKYTIEFNLKDKDPFFLESLMRCNILNKDLIMENIAEGPYGDFGDYGKTYLSMHDAGSGPFLVESFKQGDYLILKRFEDYPLVQRKLGSIDIVKFTIIPEVVTITTKLLNGEFDMCTWALEGQTFDKIKKDDRFEIEGMYLPVPWYIIMNVQKKPLDDIHVRKSIAYAYNLDQVLTDILAGGKPLEGPFPEAIRGGCTGIKTYPFDLEKAQEELKKSKYSMEELKQFELDIAAVAGSQRFQNIALLLASNLQKIGLNAQIKETRIQDIAEAATTPETSPRLTIAKAAIANDVKSVMKMHSKLSFGEPGLNSTGWYTNAEADRLYEQALETIDPEERQNIFCEIQRIIAEDCPRIFSHEDFQQIPKWRYVKGFKAPKTMIMYYEYRFENYYIDTQDPFFMENQDWY